MRVYDVLNIRNIAILGQTGAGKSNFIESLEFTAGLTNKISNPNDEIKISKTTMLNTIEYQNTKYNFLDIPGYIDFSGEMKSALTAANCAIIVVDATSDLSIGTELAFEATDEKKLPKFIFINKIDSEKADFDKIIHQLKEKFGKRIAPFHIPWGKGESFKGHINIVDLYAREYNGKTCDDAKLPEGTYYTEIRDMLLEAVAETDENLMDKYFAGEEFTTEEIHRGLRQGVIDGTLVPVICGSSYKNIGLHTTFDMIKEYMPSPLDDENIINNKDFIAQIFKTVIDPFLGVLSYAKVLSGEIKQETEVYNINKNKEEKIGKIYTWSHENLIELPKAIVGDIVVFSKLTHTKNSDTLSTNPKTLALDEIAFPKEQMLIAIVPENKADEDKISTALHKLRDEDSTFYWRRDTETKQTILGVQGEMHANKIIEKLKKKYGVKVIVTKLKVPYKETILGSSDVQGKYKKQSGGHGQYGDVKIKFSPCKEHFEFEEEIVGGVVPKSYIPAVEKGLIEAMKEGVLANYPVTGIKAVLYDGSYHEVDSSEMAFKVAASLAFKKGMLEAKPILLEPIMELKITIPEEYVGDIMGDISKKRGKVLGMESLENKKQMLIAKAPMSETFKYINDLKAMTQGRGKFEMTFSNYEEVPQELATKIIEDRK
ncbi:elongation factor G [Sneathia sanguinegens]|uniref:Elongation factor G n=1 Tax=Sneathia sanguinegens TaxID=40543 RepID=A0ABT7HKP2_9FUSO|nr:elongation factor G [Sneathia sanguinegens]MDK9580742.1 elongation factor G [Sneathia sanguinegens]